MDVSTDGQMTDKLSRLITKGRFYRARAIADDYIRHGSASAVNATVWFQFVLALFLLNKEVASAITALRNAPGYSSIMEGDLKRDFALQAIRLGRLDEAARYLDQVPGLHYGDQNRMAIYCSVRARWTQAYQLGPDKALGWFTYADDLQKELGARVNPQWVLNNRFHWFKLAVQSGKPFPYKAADLIKADPSRMRKIQYALMDRLGKRGLRISEQLDQTARAVYARLP